MFCAGHGLRHRVWCDCQAGLYTAVVAGSLISALGGSRTQIGGPTGAFVVIVPGIIVRFGLPGLAMVTLMAGIILLAMGLTGLGSAVKFMEQPSKLLQQPRFLDHVGRENIMPNIQTALDRAREIYEDGAAVAVCELGLN